MFDWKAIDHKKMQLDALCPFPQNSLNRLREKIALEWTYHSNAIEGNTLTLKETQVVLEGITVGGKSIKEHLEAMNHNEAIQYINELIQEKEDISEWQVKQIHCLVLKHIEQDNASVYRQENVLIAGTEYAPPDALLVPERMKCMLTRYHNEWQSLHPAERAALLHVDFVTIHPFVDGNGRTARLLHNFELMRAGFPPIVIKKEQRLAYYQTLEQARRAGQTDDFIKLSAECLDESLDLYCQVLKHNHRQQS